LFDSRYVAEHVDPDDELRAAAKAAIDAGNIERAATLLRMLEGGNRPADDDDRKVVPLPTRRSR
jgi:hypothetical protein